MSTRLLRRLGLAGLLLGSLSAVYAFRLPPGLAHGSAAHSVLAKPKPTATATPKPKPTPTPRPRPTPTPSSGGSQPKCRDDIPEAGSNKDKCHGRAKDDDDGNDQDDQNDQNVQNVQKSQNTQGASHDETSTPFVVGANGVIIFGSALTTAPASPRIEVFPDKGYVLARFNASTGSFQIVCCTSRANNPVVTQGGTWALLPANGSSGSASPRSVSSSSDPTSSATGITGLSVQWTRVQGGRTRACTASTLRRGCQTISVTTAPRARVRVLVAYPHSTVKQSFTGTADAHGQYHQTFAVRYDPPARARGGVRVRVMVSSTLANGSDGGTAMITFVVLS